MLLYGERNYKNALLFGFFKKISDDCLTFKTACKLHY